MPPLDFFKQPGFYANPCGMAVDQARGRVTNAQKAVDRCRKRLEALEANLREAEEHRDRVNAAYDRFCETGDIDRELLTPAIPRQERPRSEAPNGIREQGWTLVSSNLDEEFEYLRYRQTVDTSDISEALSESGWTIHHCDCYIVIRRERESHPQATQTIERIFYEWERSPDCREIAIWATKSQWRRPGAAERAPP